MLINYGKLSATESTDLQRSIYPHPKLDPHHLPHGSTPDSNDLSKRNKDSIKKARKSGDWTNYKFHQKECKREFKKAENNYINQTILEGLNQNNTKPFWRYVKSKKQDNTGVAPLRQKGTLLTDSVAKANCLLEQFCSVFTRDNPESVDVSHLTQHPNIPPPPHNNRWCRETTKKY